MGHTVGMGHDLTRFVQAQEPVYVTVLGELRSGHKRSHWMWFVFPQLAGLGRSATAQRYAIADLAHARDYLAHPVLGPRLLECAGIVAALPPGAEQVFGSVDAVKLRSSMTLFARADPAATEFPDVLARHYDGDIDAATIRLLDAAR